MAEHENDAAVIDGIGLVDYILPCTENDKPDLIIKLLVIPISIRRYHQLPDEGLFARCFDATEDWLLGGQWKLHGDPRGRALGWVNMHKGASGEEAFWNCVGHRHVLWTPDEVHLYHDSFSYAQFMLHPFLRGLSQLFTETEEDEEPH